MRAGFSHVSILPSTSLPQSSESWGHVMRTHSGRLSLGTYCCLTHTQVTVTSGEGLGFVPEGAPPWGPIVFDGCQELHFGLSANLVSSGHSNSVPSNWGLHKVGAITRTMEVPTTPSISLAATCCHAPHVFCPDPQELLPSSMASTGL